MSAKILLVDLEPEANLRIKMPLEKIGYGVEHVNSEIEIVNQAKKINYDLVLFNPALRNQNNLEVLSQVTEFAKNKGAVVIVISSSADRTHIQKSIALGVVDYLVMPFLPEEIGTRVEKNLPVKMDAQTIKGFLEKLNFDEPRILETPVFKSYKEKYKAYPVAVGNRTFCILVMRDSSPKQNAQLSENDMKEKILLFRKYSVKWELIWPA